MKRLRSLIGACLGAALLAACGGGSTYSAAPSIGTTDVQSVHRQALRRSASGPNLYVDNEDGNTVTVYAPGTTSPLRTISQDMDQPKALAFDGAGNLYVSNASSSAVTVYAAGTSTLLRTITNKLGIPRELAFDALGNLYVGNYLHNPPITVYAPGSGKVLRSISRLAKYPGALAFDAAGNLYVLDSYPSRRVAVYPPGGGRPILPIEGAGGGNDDWESIAIDSSGDLYVANCGHRCGAPGAGSVSEYAPGSNVPLRVITKGVQYPIAVALDASGNLYVANYPAFNEAGWVSVYKGDNGQFVGEITNGVVGPIALAFDGSGNLCVANSGGSGASTVTAYAPGASSPFETISEGVNYPASLAFGA